jgi:hypothetical protein
LTQQQPNKEKRSKFWLVPSSHIRIRNPKHPQVCRNQQRKVQRIYKNQNPKHPKFVEMGKKKQKQKQQQQQQQQGSMRKGVIYQSPYLQNINKKQKPTKNLAKDSRKAKRRKALMQSFSLSEIYVQFLSFFHSFAWWPLIDDFFLFGSERERGREEREKKEMSERRG